MAAILFGLAAAASLTIWLRDPIPQYAYEAGVGVLGACALARKARDAPTKAPRVQWFAVLMSLLGMWGFGQWMAGGTVYRWATLNAAMRMMGLAATGVTAWRALATVRSRDAFLKAFVCFAFLLSAVSVLAYFTSPGQVLWIFPAPYPDVWGPFLSRNNFAQFLELALPTALWFGLAREPSRGGRRLYLGLGAVLLAAGLASASRAGAVLLVGETGAVFWLAQRARGPTAARATIPRALAEFFAATALLGVLAGAGTLWHRFRNTDPLEYRREIYRSAVHMIARHPWTGTGLGTFERVYPSYATFDSGAVVEHAHNDWLEWAAEGGLGYVAVWGALAIFLVRPGIRSIWGLGVLAVFVHAAVDYPFARFGVSAWAFILAGALARSDISSEAAASVFAAPRPAAPNRTQNDTHE